MNIVATSELERQRDQYLKELADNSDRLLRRYDQHTKEMEARFNFVTMTCEILKVQFQQVTVKAKHELDTYRVKYEMGETRIKAIVAKHRLKLNHKVEEALTSSWMEWVAQVVELQVFREDTENWRKEGRSCYKMDENNIQILREDLTIEHHHEEFNDDQMLLRLGSEAYECDHIQAEKEEEANIQASTGPMTEEAAQEQPEEEETQQETAQTIEPQ